MVGWLPFIVPTGPEVGRASRLQDLPDAGGGPLGVFRPFCPLYCVALVVLLANMALFGFLLGFSAGFGVVVWVCISCVLCVACGAFYVRV